MKTLPKYAVAILDKLENNAAGIYETWQDRLKQVPDLPSYVQKKPPEYYEGMLDMVYMDIEMALFQFGAYEGYNIVWPRKSSNGLRRYIYNNPAKGVKYS